MKFSKETWDKTHTHTHTHTHYEGLGPLGYNEFFKHWGLSVSLPLLKAVVPSLHIVSLKPFKRHMQLNNVILVWCTQTQE